MLDASIVIDTVNICLKGMSEGVDHSHLPLLTQQNRLRSQTLVLHLLLLQCSKTSYRSSHHRPQLLPLKRLLLECSSSDLVRKGLVWMFPKRVNLVEIGAEVIFSTFLYACV